MVGPSSRSLSLLTPLVLSVAHLTREQTLDKNSRTLAHEDASLSLARSLARSRSVSHSLNVHFVTQITGTVLHTCSQQSTHKHTNARTHFHRRTRSQLTVSQPVRSRQSRRTRQQSAKTHTRTNPWTYNGNPCHVHTPSRRRVGTFEACMCRSHSTRKVLPRGGSRPTRQNECSFSFRFCRLLISFSLAE